MNTEAWRLRPQLWTDEITHPSSVAMGIAMRAAEADAGLVDEWRTHCDENYEGSDWICYAEWLDIELEMTLDNLADLPLGDVLSLTRRAYTIALELEKGMPLTRKVLVRCTGTRYFVNKDAPEEGTDILHTRECPMHPNAPIIPASLV